MLCGRMIAARILDEQRVELLKGESLRGGAGAGLNWTASKPELLYAKTKILRSLHH